MEDHRAVNVTQRQEGHVVVDGHERKKEHDFLLDHGGVDLGEDDLVEILEEGSVKAEEEVWFWDTSL